MGSFQTSVLVKVSVQWGETWWAPQALWGKGSLLPLTSSRPAWIGKGLLTARCVTDTQSVAPHVQPSICECVSESWTHTCPWCQLCRLPTHLPASYFLFLDEAPRSSWAQHGHHGHTDAHVFGGPGLLASCAAIQKEGRDGLAVDILEGWIINHWAHYIFGFWVHHVLSLCSHCTVICLPAESHYLNFAVPTFPWGVVIFLHFHSQIVLPHQHWLEFILENVFPGITQV